MVGRKTEVDPVLHEKGLGSAFGRIQMSPFQGSGKKRGDKILPRSVPYFYDLVKAPLELFSGFPKNHFETDEPET
jgi:hypothetical protein